MMSHKYILGAILLVALITRVLFLGNVPFGFTGDETGQGYSAYSIFKTAKDEWGVTMPIFPRSFGDFKPPLYTYLTAPFVGFLGLNIENTRLPAAILGVLLILVAYLLSLELFKDRSIALWSSFLLSINPWHIQLSRTAHEGNLGILTFALGLLFFLKVKNNVRYLSWAAFIWGLGLYSYHSVRVFIILFVIGLVIYYKKNIINQKSIVALVILSVFVLPLIFNYQLVLTRSADVGIMGNNTILGYFGSKGESRLPHTIDKIFDNKIGFVVNYFTTNYLSYLSPTFFFTGSRSGDNYYNFSSFGLLYFVEILFWICAIKLILERTGYRFLLLFWFLLAGVPAALSVGGVNANRALMFLPLTAIISGYGLKQFIVWCKAQREKIPVSQILILILIINFIFFLHHYLIKIPKAPINSLNPGYKQVFEKVIEYAPGFDEVVISKSFGVPQIYVAFYGKVDPQFYQNYSKEWLRYESYGLKYMDQMESWSMGKFLFEGINWEDQEGKRANALIVARAEEFPEGVRSIYDYKDSRGKVIFRLVDTKDSSLNER